MRKYTLVLICCTLLVTVTRSQLRVALVAGGHQSTVIEENDQPGWDETKNYYSGRTGFHGGFIADLRFSPSSRLWFQPGVLYYHKGKKYNQSFDPTISTYTQYKTTQFVNYIDLPMNLVLKFGNKTKFIIGGGPYGSFFFNGKTTEQLIGQTGIITDEENDDLPVGKKPGQYRIFNYGVNGLAGIEFNRVFITANYSRGLNDFFEPVDYTATDMKHQVIGGTLGIFLGKPVTPEKKPKDRDKDGIPDDQDQCPDLAGPAVTNGCPDKDGDGIADQADKCPDTPGLAKYNGCPVPDSDGDGVKDDADQCPAVPGLAKYNGCPPPDTDGDGVNDEEDKCPAVAGVPRYQGCPVPDTDGDGVNDEEDKCPTVKETKAHNGCPEEVKKEIVEKVNYAAKKIQFTIGKSTLLPASFDVLDEVVDVLKDNPGLNLLIEGHTSRDGSLDFNMRLSEDRAGAVKAYLLEKGVDASRITTRGYGPTQPLNEGRTPAERAKNRRVELKLSN